MVGNNLPPHLRTEVGLWVTYFEGRGIDPTAVEYPGPEYFVFDVLASKSLTARLSCINAINEWYVKFLRRRAPFENPWGYPLLTRFLPYTFAEAYARVANLPDPDRGYAALVLVCRFSITDVTTWGGFVRPNLVEHTNRVVPVNHTVAGWLTPWVRPTPAQARAAVAQVGSVADLHGALFAELAARGVHETTRASLYGRWSAMKFQTATKRLGFFRVPV